MWPRRNRCWSQLTVNITTKSTWAVGSKGGTAVTTVQADLQDLITFSLPNSQITAKHCSHHILHWFSWLMSQGVQLRSACKPEPSPAIAQSLPYGNQKLQSFTSGNCRHSLTFCIFLLSPHITPDSTVWILKCFSIFNSVKHLAGNSPCSNMYLIKILTTSYHLIVK